MTVGCGLGWGGGAPGRGWAGGRLAGEHSGGGVCKGLGTHLGCRESPNVAPVTFRADTTVMGAVLNAMGWGHSSWPPDTQQILTAPSPRVVSRRGPRSRWRGTHRPDEAQQPCPGEGPVRDRCSSCSDWDSLHRAERGPVRLGTTHNRRWLAGRRAQPAHGLPARGCCQPGGAPSRLLPYVPRGGAAPSSSPCRPVFLLCPFTSAPRAWPRGAGVHEVLQTPQQLQHSEHQLAWATSMPRWVVRAPRLPADPAEWPRRPAHGPLYSIDVCGAEFHRAGTNLKDAPRDPKQSIVGSPSCTGADTYFSNFVSFTKIWGTVYLHNTHTRWKRKHQQGGGPLTRVHWLLSAACTRSVCLSHFLMCATYAPPGCVFIADTRVNQAGATSTCSDPSLERPRS